MLETVSAATALWRVWRPDPAHPSRTAASFNPTARPDILQGGRFDALVPSYAYLYVGLDEEAAIAETLTRGLPYGAGARLVADSVVDKRVLTRLEAARDLKVLALHGAARFHVDAPPSVTQCEPDGYVRTRQWAARLRQWVPGVDGLSYRCRHDEDRMALVLFEDGTAAGSAATGPLVLTSPPTAGPGDRRLDIGAGRSYLSRVLQKYNADLP